jgi:protein farnesyltransferase/geranylgeranyltransferase type-1 subunit alpha
MSGSSSEESIDIEVPYSKRPEWADLSPILQDEETNDIVRIAYTETFKEVFSYFRAILKLNEKSERAFELTKDAALLNPANYTVWYYRRILIKELNKDLNEELDFITNVIRSNPKNYQVWQHRRNIVEYLHDAKHELLFTEQILKKDSKNYHAWQYRQWVIKAFGLWQNELDYINELIDADIRNNSAWNQRYFYTSHVNELTKPESMSVLKSEIEYCLNKIDLCIDNESSWNYLRAIINHLCDLNEDPTKTLYPQNVIDFCERKFVSEKEDDRSPFLISFMVDCNLFKARAIVKKTKASQSTETFNINDDKQALKELIKNSIEMLESLGAKYDTIRVNYWNYLILKWKNEFADYV